MSAARQIYHLIIRFHHNINSSMQTVRIHNRLPQQAYRTIIKPNPSTSRNMTLFYPRFVANEFAPMFRLADDLTRAFAAPTTCRPTARKIRSFQPRFDVKETRDAYELQGELPGMKQKDLEVFFQDANTLQIKGRTERHHEESSGPSQQSVEAIEAQQPEAVVEAQNEQPADTASETSSYHKATVETENEDGFIEASASDAATPAATPQQPAQTQDVAPQPQEQQQRPKRPEGQYWVSERSVGQFARTFTFPNRIDQQAVKASLKEGILSIVVPKAAVPEPRRINIE